MNVGVTIDWPAEYRSSLGPVIRDQVHLFGLDELCLSPCPSLSTQLTSCWSEEGPRLSWLNARSPLERRVARPWNTIFVLVGIRDRSRHDTRED